MRQRWAGCLAVFCLLAGCAGPAAHQPQTAAFFAMDTVMDFTIYGDTILLDGARGKVDELEAWVSVTDSSSELYKINRDGTGTLAGDAAELMAGALALCRRTGGALDLSVYPVVQAWGFTTGVYQVPDDAVLERLLHHVGYARIDYDAETGLVSVPDGMQIDLGSVAKGYAGRQAARYLRDNGVVSALLNLGGNIQTIGGRPDGTPWQIAVQQPRGGAPMVVLAVRDQAVVTSGGYERFFTQEGKTYGHIMNPATGRPAESGLLSVTVVGEDGLVCDGLSTALYVMGLEKAVDFWRNSSDFEAVFVSTDDVVYLTDGLASCFSLTEAYPDAEVRLIARQ